jgi:SAM-dependent methyltransferase
MRLNARSDQSATPPSPLTGHSAGVTLIRTLDTASLIRGYRNRHAVDIAPLFDGIATIGMFHDNESGLSFFDPPIAGDAGFYASMAQRAGYHRPDKAEFRIASRFVPPAASVLEVGAGIGHFADHIPGHSYLGLEFNTDAVAAAEAIGRRVIACDARALALTMPGHFDVSCAFQVLEHVTDPRSLIEAMVALTRPGGRIILATPNAGSFISRSRDLLNLPPHHLTWWEDRTWHWVAEALGLVAVQIYHTPMTEMTIAWAQMVASQGVARQRGVVLDPVLDETPEREAIDRLAAPLAQILCAGITTAADLPEAGHTSVAIFTKPLHHAAGQHDANT